MPDGGTAARERLWVWAGISLAWLVWGAVNTFRMHEIVPRIDWATAVWYAVPDAVIWALLTPVIVLVTRQIAASGKGYLETLPLHIAAALGTALVHTGADSGVAVLRGLLYGDPVGFAPVFVKLLIHAVHVNVLVYFLISGFAYYLHSSRALAQRRRRTAELRAELSAAQLASLQTQLRPHFLFNALHTISGLVVSDPKRAQRAIRQLGELLRMSLKGGERQTIPLAEEIAFVEAYLGVEQARFGERLRVELDVEEGLADEPVPALILQPLVENAVRHGVSRNPAGGCLWISAAAANGRLRLVVSDDGPGMEAGEEGSGVGLANTRARLAALYGPDHGFSITGETPRGVRVTVELPRRGREEAER